MFRKALPCYGLFATVLLAMTAIAGSAQVRPESELSRGGAGDVTATAQLVKTGLYLITSGRGNSLLRLSANGLILVDGTRPGSYRASMSQVRNISRMSDLPIRFLFLTDHHEDHAGNNAQFIAAGVRIIGHENVARNLTAYNPPGGRPAPPTTTYDHDYALRLGGVDAQLMHFGNAHTSGDTVVYFPNLRVVAAGDLFARTPDPDFAGGGSLVNWGPVLGQVLKLDFDVVVPSRGPMVVRADLELFKTKIDTLVSRATALVKRGVSKDRLMVQLKTDDLGWRFDFGGDRLERFYDELSRTR